MDFFRKTFIFAVQLKKQTYLYEIYPIFPRGGVLSLLFLAIIFISCQKDEYIKSLSTISEPSTSSSARPGEISIIEGRLFFPNGEAFEKKFYEFTEKPLTDLYDFMQPFYEQGFFSLRPPAIYEYHQEEVIQQYQQRIKNFKTSSNINNYSDEQIYNRIDETSYMIVDPGIAAFLNTDGEVQIGDAILKFTDVGVFVVPSSKYPKLKTYLNANEISDNLLNPTNKNIAKNIWNTYQSGLSVAPDVFYHNSGLILLEEAGPNYWPHSGSDSNWGDNPVLGGLPEYISTLTPCDSRSSLFGWIFGTHKICTNNYDTRRRVKTEVYNLHVSFDIKVISFSMTSIGIKVRNQRRAFGIWWRKKADVVVASVPMFQVKYDYSSILTPADIYNLNPQGVQYSYKLSNVSYVVDTDIWSDGSTTYDLDFSINYPNYPTFIQDGLVIESIGNNTIDNYIDQGNEALTSEELNKLFWETVHDNVTSQMNSLSPNYVNPDDMALISNYPNNAVLYAHKTHFDYCTNCRNENENFGFQAGAGFSVSYDPSNGRFDYDAGAPGSDLVLPEDMRIQMVGAVKVNGTWHGSKLVHNIQ